jgi:DUF1680 family protein
VYGPSEVTAKVGDGIEVTIVEETNYPFNEDIQFKINTNEDVKFPFHLRVPEWCKNAKVFVNGEPVGADPIENIIVINREWKDNDEVVIHLGMEFRYSYWNENSLGIERGPLVYALKVEEEWKEVSKAGKDDSYWEVWPTSPWNYSLSKGAIEKNKLEVEAKSEIALNPWNLRNAPITVKTKARRQPVWELENHSTGKIPVQKWDRMRYVEEEEIVLIPYGCTTLRISQFPIY